MSQPKPLTPPMRIFVGLLCLVAGLLPALAAFDVGPLHSADIHGPPWLGLVAGGVFILAGVAVILGERRQGAATGLTGTVLGAAILCGFAAIGNWIAFGPGPRVCSVEIAGFFLDGALASEVSCRIGFGIGAMMVNGFLLLIAGSLAARRSALAPLARLLDRAGLALICLALAPIALPWLLALLGKGVLQRWRA